jgi:glycine/D-amino acid oxidase-like deaminating enzyme
MKTTETHIVIGAGIAGCLSALFRKRAGFRVILLDRNRSEASDAYPVCTETSNIVSENHSGAEYPFDPQSARDCFDGRLNNEKFFPEIIYGGKDYTRIIASQSMICAGVDILARCRRNMDVIRTHYEQRCREDTANRVFGNPDLLCQEIAGVDGVRDVAGAFVTPQRGLNPLFVATTLEWELRCTGVEFRQGACVTAIKPLNDGRYEVELQDSESGQTEIVADQVSLCSAAHAFQLAKWLKPDFAFPPIYMALREILYVSLPDGTDKNFTCLKLENEYGGMLSPLNDECAMVYYPPAAHILNCNLDPVSGNYPQQYRDFLANGHPEQHERARWTLEALRRFYPELNRSEILGTYLKVAINSVADSRVRRNLGVYQLMPACTMTILPKWTMCVVNVRKEMDLVLGHSCSTGNMDREEMVHCRHEVANYQLETPAEWAIEPELLRGLALRHAANMKVPELLAKPMQSLIPS